ncbi:hypothetical protein E3E12_02255 [Formicincola oecophyllae]|uniref:Uncharacterized protein n=1 Tax=Formicincola oecophyllae TaxID=2558361 RepID=A0A4Y6U7S8_9PROT|nr:hypothetical protein [Formicincola oecophyllae]QDH13214.1 hypothetical protein E3E12_02255 [Formicincola oecophyllae]
MQDLTSKAPLMVPGLVAQQSGYLYFSSKKRRQNAINAGWGVGFRVKICKLGTQTPRTNRFLPETAPSCANPAHKT